MGDDAEGERERERETRISCYRYSLCLHVLWYVSVTAVLTRHLL